MDAGATITYSISGGADAALFNIGSASGVVTFKASPNFEAPADANGDNVYHIVVRASDGELYAEKSVAITVLNENETPSMSNISISVTEDMTYTFAATDFSSVYSDVEETSIASITVKSLPIKGTLKLSGNSIAVEQVITAANFTNITFVPNANQNGPDSFTITASDGVLNSNTVDVNITIAAVNDAAVISEPSAVSIPESNEAQSVSGVLTVADADAGETLFVAQTGVAGNNNYGLFTIDASGNWSYTMNNTHDEFIAGQTYSDSITVSSVDGTASQVITVTMTGTNDIPTIGGQNTGSIIQSNEAQSVSGSLSVVDLDAGESLFVAQTDVSGNNNYGLFTIGTNGAWSYTMNNAHTEFAAGIAYTDRITVSSVDGTATQDIIVTITGINNAPVITSTNTSQVTTAVGTSTAVYTVTSTDVDENNILTYSISGGADASLCNIGSSTGAVTFKANPTVGIYYITVKVADENSAYVEKEITIIVTSETAANHTALTDANVETILEDSVVVGDVTVSDLTTTANVEVPYGSTLTVASGELSGGLSGNGSVVVAGIVILTNATLDNFTGRITVLDTLIIGTNAGSMITLTSNNNGSTNAIVKISSTNTTTPTIISTDLYASSDATIENTHNFKAVVLTGILYKQGKTFTFNGLIEIEGRISGTTPYSDESLPYSDVNIGNASGVIAAVVYASTDQDAYLYDGATTVYNGSSLTLNNGANLENSVVTINVGATLILNYIDTPIHIKELIIYGNLIVNLNSDLSQGQQCDILTTTNGFTHNYPININYNGSNSSSIYIFGYTTANQKEYKIVANNPASNVCFPAKTPVLTNRGYVNIDEIDLAVHTIRNKKIVAITKTVAHDKNLVRIAKHALGKNYPEKTTLISQNHKVFCKGQMVKAKHLVGENKNVTLVPYNGQVLYNVLLVEHEKMQVNNLIVETLHPEHKVAKLYRFFKNVDASHHGKLIALFNKKDQEHRKSTF